MRILHFIIITAFLGMGTVASAQNYYLKYDSVKIMTIKTGKKYHFKTLDGDKQDVLKSINNDTFFFENSTYHFKEITALKNPKRKATIDAIALPITVGSCVAVSTIPITYVKGYFLADTDMMFRTVGIFIIETTLFSMSRSYLSKHKKWISISEMNQLNLVDKPIVR